MSVSLTKVFSPQPGWYCGDFHAHTTCSDGALSPKGLSKLAAEQGLDFVSITDHNDVRAFDEYDDSFECMVLPGVEVTLIQGHFNVFGFEGDTETARQLFHTIVDRPSVQVYQEGKDHVELTALLARLSNNGLLVDIAHPLLWPWEWRDTETEIACFTAIELVNDPTYKDNPKANPDTRRMWSAWLNADHRLTALGGTDFHSSHPSDDRSRLSRLNLPLTYVYANQLSGRAILEGVRRRHAYITIGPKIEFTASMEGNDYLMGDDLGDVHSPVRLSARVEGCSGPAWALLVKDGELVTEIPVQNGKAEIEWQVLPGNPQSCWYRFDVIGHDAIIGHDDQSIAISNPIFLGPHRLPEARTFGSFMGSSSRF